MTMVYDAWHGDDSTDHAELSLEKREEIDREKESAFASDARLEPTATTLHYTVRTVLSV